MLHDLDPSAATGPSAGPIRQAALSAAKSCSGPRLAGAARGGWRARLILWLTWAGLAASPVGAGAAAPPQQPGAAPQPRPMPTLAYQPVALAWSAGEVEQATDEQLDTLIRQAHAAGELGCEAQCDRLHSLFDRLLPLARSQTPHAAQLHWTLTVVRSTGVEALALPAGHVVVSEAFVRASALDDAALAFVIAHEMAHCILQHERQALTVARMLLPRGAIHTVQDVYTEIDFNFQLLKSLEPAMQMGELEADELGLLLAAAAGYDPQRQLRFMEREAALPPGPRPLVRTHPPAAERLARLRERLPLAQRLHARALGNAAATAAQQALRSR